MFSSSIIEEGLLTTIDKSDKSPYLPKEPGYLVAMFPRGDPPSAGVAVDPSAAVVEDLSSSQIAAEHVGLLPKQFVERFHQHKHGVVHQRSLCL